MAAPEMETNWPLAEATTFAASKGDTAASLPTILAGQLARAARGRLEAGLKENRAGRFDRFRLRSTRDDEQHSDYAKNDQQGEAHHAA